MKDPIERAAAIDAVYERIRQIGYENYPHVLSIRQAIRDLPSAQPEVIHCRDCKYYTPVTARCEVRGKGLYLIRNMEDFCSRAERRTND